MLHLTKTREILSDTECQRRSNGLPEFFIDEIRQIKAVIRKRLGHTYEDPLQFHSKNVEAMLGNLKPLTAEEIPKMIRSMTGKSSPVDFIPTTVIKNCAEMFSELIARLVHLLFKEVKFLDIYN
jgi:hypothetical protein